MSTPAASSQQGDAGSPTASSAQSLSSGTIKTAGDQDELFSISPSTALSMFCAHIGDIVRLTGDVPPTPLMKAAFHSKAVEPEEIESTPLKVTELHCSQAKDPTVEGAVLETIQQNALAKKFFSKKAPPISLEEYISRLQRYCPMSAAVYLAASLYITRLATVEKIIFLTPRNVHRLVLASLRVAMKALEDLSYPHSRFARVGGVSERELSRLEISFCFLADFELKVDPHMLMNEARSMQKGGILVGSVPGRSTGTSDHNRDEQSVPAVTAPS
ncbi:hypothetical protein Plec18167_008926 [Paecilomyces lecythidis]|uniref:Cyclin-domain-containing protein n=1 Tax=Paecilomyces lecythidis TaxID=3004212 RepID=A0ABR3WSZ8_9EURO